ncbi:hypothetical protein [Acinetobacter bereziniae]|uniref:hypothetical protein n=1 Tax=Acinetobacter bereziniae TaxID=106648 RepID=UPI003017E37E
MDIKINNWLFVAIEPQPKVTRERLIELEVLNTDSTEAEFIASVDEAWQNGFISEVCPYDVGDDVQLNGQDLTVNYFQITKHSNSWYWAIELVRTN